MIAIEVSSAAGRPPFGGIATLIRNQIGALLAQDPITRYALCYKLSRWRKVDLFAPSAPNAKLRVLVDPFNKLVLPGARLLHATSSYLPRTPRVTRLASIYDLNHVRNPQWASPHHLERRQLALREMISRSDHVVTHSRHAASEVCDVYGVEPGRVHVVPAGVDSAAFRPLSTDEIERTRARHGEFVLAIGLITPRKNFETLVEAVSLLKDLRLIVVGRRSWGAERFFAAVEESGMRERVEHLEDVPHDELVALINAARAFAVPSLYEGFGLIALEAMACGTPVVASRATSLPEVVGDAALLVDATRAEALADAIGRATEDSSLAAELRERGLARARSLSWEASARQLRALYRTISSA